MPESDLGAPMARRDRRGEDRVHDVPVRALTSHELRVLDSMVDATRRSDGIVARYDRRTGRGLVVDRHGRELVFTAKRKYLRRGAVLSFVADGTRAYHVRREAAGVVDGDGSQRR